MPKSIKQTAIAAAKDPTAPSRSEPWTAVKYLYHEEFDEETIRYIALRGVLSPAERLAFYRALDSVSPHVKHEIGGARGGFWAHSVGVMDITPWERRRGHIDKYPNASRQPWHELAEILYGPEVHDTANGDAWRDRWEDIDGEGDCGPLAWDRYNRSIQEFCADLVTHWKRIRAAKLPAFDPTKTSGAERQQFGVAMHSGSPKNWHAYMAAVHAKDLALVTEALAAAPVGTWGTMPKVLLSTMLRHAPTSVRARLVMELGPTAEPGMATARRSAPRAPAAQRKASPAPTRR